MYVDDEESVTEASRSLLGPAEPNRSRHEMMIAVSERNDQTG